LRSPGSCFAAAREYQNGVTSWLDLGNIYGLYDGSSGIIDEGVVTITYAAATLPYQTVATLLVRVHNYFASELTAGGCLIDQYTLYLAAQQATVYWYQNVLRWHLLPAFFAFQTGSTPGSTPDYAHISSAYVAPDNVDVPLAEVPLAILLNLTQSLYGEEIPAIDTSASIDTLTLQLRALMATPARAFGSAGVAAADYSTAHVLAEDLGLPEFTEFRCNLLGDYGDCMISPNGSTNGTNSSSGSQDFSFGSGGCEDDLWNNLIAEAQQLGSFMGYELDLQPAFYSAQSSWSPTALALTYGVIRKQLLNDPRSKTDATGFNFAVWDPSLESAMAMVCGGTLTNSLVLSMVSDPNALSNVLTGANFINTLTNQCGSLTWPLIYSPDGVSTDADNDFSSCCYAAGAPACTSYDPIVCEPDAYGNCPSGCMSNGFGGCNSNPCYPFTPFYCPAGCGANSQGDCFPVSSGY